LREGKPSIPPDAGEDLEPSKEKADAVKGGNKASPKLF